MAYDKNDDSQLDPKKATSKASDANEPDDIRRLSDDTNSGSSASDTQSSDRSGTAETKNADAELEKIKKEFLYLYAEFENYKKNAIKERSDLRKYGAERLAADLLSVIDVFEKALGIEDSAENHAAFRQGVEMIAKELKQTLIRNGIEEQAALGVLFDPAVHDALSSEETDAYPDGHISQVIKKPYRLHDRIIRHGQVVVAHPKKQT